MRRWMTYATAALLTGAALLLPAPDTTHAISVSGIAAVGVTDVVGDCSRAIVKVALYDRAPTVDDGGGLDYYYLVVFDGSGTPHYSAYLGAPSPGPTATIYPDVDLTFHNAALSRPFSVTLYEVTTPGAMPISAVMSSPQVATTTFDPADFAASCGALPVGVSGFADGRINSLAREPWQTVAIYCRPGGVIDIYAIDETTSGGYLVIRATPADIAAVGVPSNANALIASSTDGDVRLYRLTSGEFQVNAPAVLGGDLLRDGYVFIWESC